MAAADAFRDAPPSAARYGVAGWPLDHTLSPAMHNAAIRALGLNAVYRAIPVPPAEWPAWIARAGSVPLEGFNVTVPFKELILKEGGHPLPWNAERCALVGAVNTVRRGRGGWEAFNTDIGGLQDDLRAQGVAFRGGAAVLLGSGGAARAAAAALVGLPQSPRRIWILNRTPEKARALARDFSGGPVEVLGADMASGEAAFREAVLAVNATSVGLAPDDPSPVPPAWLHPGLVAYDMIYHRETAFLKAAAAAGAKAIGGLGMLVHQGARSFEIWFNEKPSPEIMRKAAENELKRRRKT